MVCSFSWSPLPRLFKLWPLGQKRSLVSHRLLWGKTLKIFLCETRRSTVLLTSFGKTFLLKTFLFRIFILNGKNWFVIDISFQIFTAKSFFFYDQKMGLTCAIFYSKLDFWKCFITKYFFFFCFSSLILNYWCSIAKLWKFQKAWTSGTCLKSYPPFRFLHILQPFLVWEKNKKIYIFFKPMTSVKLFIHRKLGQMVLIMQIYFCVKGQAKNQFPKDVKRRQQGVTCFT